MFEELNTEINTLLDTIADEQSTHIVSNTNYKQYFRTSETNFDYSVTEYKNGHIGYQVIFYKTDNGKEYIKSVGYGNESESRTKDWTEIIND